MLAANYFPNGSILSDELGSHPSQVWRAILEGTDVLCQGLTRRIGYGSSTRIWAHNWIPGNATMWPIASLMNDPPNLVSEIIDSTSATRRKDIINQVFLAADANAI